MNWRMLVLTLGTLLAGYRQRAWEPLLVVIALAMGFIGVSAVAMVAEGNQNERQQQQYGVVVHGSVTARANHNLQVSDYARLRQQGLTALVAVSTSTLYDEHGQALDTPLWAVDMMALASVPTTAPLALGHPSTLATLPRTLLLADGSVVPAIQTNERLPLAAILVDTGWFYQQSRTLEAYPLTQLLWLGQAPSAADLDLMQQLPAHLQWQTWPQEDESGSLPDSFVLNLWAMAALMALVCAVIVINATHLCYRARLPQLIILRQLGIGVSSLSIVLLIEMLIGLTLASAIGVGLGYQLTLWLTPSLAYLFSGYRADVGQFISLAMLQRWGQLWCVGALLLVLLQWLPLRQLRHALLMRQPSAPVSVPWFKLALLCSGLGLISFFATQQLFTAFVTLALVLLSGCLWLLGLLPPLLQWISRRLPPTFPLLHWSGAETSILSARLRIALCAFFLAMTANLGLHMMVQSFRLATDTWLSQRLVAPVYGYSNSEQDLSDFSTDTAPIFARYTATARLTQPQALIPVEVVSLPQHPAFASSVVLESPADEAMSAFFSGAGILISQQLAFKAQLTTGDTLALQFTSVSSSPSVNYKILGVYSDYGNLQPQVMLPVPAVKPFADPPRSYAFFDDLDSANALLSAKGIDIDLMRQETLAANAMRVFDNTFVLTDGLNLITLCVAALSFFISISLLALDRQKQLSLLRALGVSSTRIRLALAFQFALLCTATGVLAFPFATVLAWCLIHHINLFAFAWHYPLHLDVLQLISVLLISILAMLLLLALPLGRLVSRLNTRGDVSL